MGRPAKQWGFFASILVLSPFLVGIPLLAGWAHYHLPTPLHDLFNANNEPQLSEKAILEYARVLSEDIGYRTVGTREHAAGDAWMLKKAEELKEQCEAAVKSEPGRKLHCEVWHQVGDGSHRFDILQTRLYKTYVGLTNIVLRISDGTPTGQEHAVLVNAHLDSTLPSPGAADDALSVGVMIETARNLIATKGWEPTWSIIFLFNNAEESLQDGSHLFSTQHPIAPTVRAAINLEAAGTEGPTLLFQATSEEMIEAYAHVPKPCGTIVANDIFSSGIIGSDTDFRQFELYLNVTGLDMAVVGHSYFYHTQKDLVENIEPGVAQHMAEQTLSLLRYLTSSSSPLPTLTTGYRPPQTVFFSPFNWVMVRYSFRTANTMYWITLVSSVVLLFSSVPKRLANGKGKNGPAQIAIDYRSHLTDHAWGFWLCLSGLLGSLLAVNFVAFIMSAVLDRSLSWFKEEYSCILLYGPAALAGALATQLPFRDIRERSLVTSILLTQTTLACLLQYFGIGSAVVYWFSAVPLLVTLACDFALHGQEDHIWLGTYGFGQITALLFGGELVCSVTDIFVPLSGRMGTRAPAEYLIATIVTFLLLNIFPLSIAFFHRFGRRFLVRAFYSSIALTVVMMAIFSQRNPFDSMHPKRLFIVHSHNITAGTTRLGISAADSAPHFPRLAQDLAGFVTKDGIAVATEMTPHNGEWDPIYPLAAFLEPYMIDLEALETTASRALFAVTSVNDIVDVAAGTRTFTIKITHPGLIWTVIAFDAHVLKWSLDDNPPQEHTRHHIKQAGFYGVDSWTVDVTIKLPSNGDHRGVPVNFVGIEEHSMWPAKKHQETPYSPSMQLFEKLDGWMKERTGDTVDAMYLGCVSGIVTI